MPIPTFDDLRSPCLNGGPIPLDLLQDYIEAGEDVNYRDDRPESRRLLGGWTLMHYAADVGDVRSIRILADCGADVNAQAADGRTPLHLAIDRDFVVATQGNHLPNSFPTAEALFRRGADDSLVNERGERPFDPLASFPELIAIYQRAKQGAG